jgi:hypothetical protein
MRAKIRKIHRLRQPAQRRAENKEPDRDENHYPAAVKIAQLAIKRRHHGRRQDIGGDDPA